MPHHFYQTCAYFTAARYLRTMERLTDRIFAPTGMKPAYAYLMMALEDQHPTTIMELADLLGYERSTVSRLVKTLAAQNLVELSSVGRATSVDLAPASHDFLKTANACLDQLTVFTDQTLGADKATMTELLTVNQTKLRSKLS